MSVREFDIGGRLQRAIVLAYFLAVVLWAFDNVFASSVGSTGVNYARLFVDAPLAGYAFLASLVVLLLVAPLALLLTDRASSKGAFVAGAVIIGLPSELLVGGLWSSSISQLVLPFVVGSSLLALLALALHRQAHEGTVRTAKVDKPLTSSKRFVQYGAAVASTLLLLIGSLLGAAKVAEAQSTTSKEALSVLVAAQVAAERPALAGTQVNCLEEMKKSGSALCHYLDPASQRKFAVLATYKDGKSFHLSFSDGPVGR